VTLGSAARLGHAEERVAGSGAVCLVELCFDLAMASSAPGWDAIDAHLGQLYPGAEPRHYGTLHRFSLGGPDPLDGVSYYPRAEPVPHWHIVGYGMSELYAKETGIRLPLSTGRGICAGTAGRHGSGVWSPTTPRR
jgi:hypothetical protein